MRTVSLMAVQSDQERFSRTACAIDDNFSMHLLRGEKREKEP